MRLWKRIVWAGLVLSSAAGGLVACSSDSRNEPEPEQMCRTLVQRCAGFKSQAPQQCLAVGEQGLANPAAQDRCFVLYDTCIVECEWYQVHGEDAGPDAGDAAASPAVSQAVEAGSPVLDAASPTELGANDAAQSRADGGAEQ